MCSGVGYGYTTNLGRATSEGIEVQASAYITEAVRVDAGASWIDARLTSDVPLQGLLAGDRLPAPRFNANLGLQYALTIGGYDAFLRANSIYVGPFHSEVSATAANKVGDYLRLDTSARLVVRDLDIDLFVRNVTNADDFTYGSAPPSSVLLRLRPRTIGIQIGRDF